MSLVNIMEKKKDHDLVSIVCPVPATLALGKLKKTKLNSHHDMVIFSKMLTTDNPVLTLPLLSS